MPNVNTAGIPAAADMRKKSEAKRQAILEAAAEAFRELGFERTSMSAICARAGGSKATLYSYFSSKEELFFEVMFSATAAKFKVSHSSLDPTTGNIAEALRKLGEGMLAFLYSPAMLAARRLVIAEASRSDLGRLCYERGPKRGEAFISGFLQAAMRAGKLRRTDPKVAATHLRGLLESELVDRFHFNLTDSINETEITAVTSRAIDVFMAAYGPEHSMRPWH